jgi:hypothetical protein
MAIKTWVFLLQRIDDLTWHSLTPGASFLPGDYRLSIQSTRANASMEIRLLCLSPQGTQTVKCHSDSTDDNGNLPILPPWQLSAGAWQIHCRPDVFAALSGEEWQEELNFMVAELVEVVDAEPVELTPPPLATTLAQASNRHALLSALLDELPAALELELDVEPLPLSHGLMAEPLLRKLKDFESSLSQPLVLPPLEEELTTVEPVSPEPAPQWWNLEMEPEPLDEGAPPPEPTIETQEPHDRSPEPLPLALEAVDISAWDSAPEREATQAPSGSCLVTYVLQLDDTEKKQSFRVDVTLWEDLSRPSRFLDLPRPEPQSRRFYYLKPLPNQILPPKLQPRNEVVTPQLKFEKVEPRTR